MPMEIQVKKYDRVKLVKVVPLLKIKSATAIQK
jgi:hypothetical protein